jgi:thiol:disulfide interchange protein DsbC
MTRTQDRIAGRPAAGQPGPPPGSRPSARTSPSGCRRWAIDEVSKSPMPGLYEVRVGSDLLHRRRGQLPDPRADDRHQAARNLTEERVEKLTAIDFDQLPLKDSFTIVRGNGKRKLAVFEDPNCGYCKRFERELQKVDNVTVYMFLYPILGPDSVVKSRNIWCAKDKGKAWPTGWCATRPAHRAGPAATPRRCAQPSSSASKHKITGTPDADLRRRHPRPRRHRRGRRREAARRSQVIAPPPARAGGCTTASRRPTRTPTCSTSRSPSAARPPKQRLSLPVWIPGSYLVREFSKNLQRLSRAAGRQAGAPAAAGQVHLAGRLPRRPARWS